MNVECKKIAEVLEACFWEIPNNRNKLLFIVFYDYELCLYYYNNNLPYKIVCL